jgi:hypothetical protein
VRVGIETFPRCNGVVVVDDQHAMVSV